MCICEAYLAKGDPGLGQVDEKAVLAPPPGGDDFLESEVVAVLLQVDLDDEGDGVDWGGGRRS